MPMTQITLMTAFDHIEQLIVNRYGGLSPKRLDQPGELPSDGPSAASHILWLVKTAKDSLSTGAYNREKLMRWLGFAQGWAWTTKQATIQDFRDANRPPEE